MLPILLVALIIALFVFSVMGRVGHTGLQELRKWSYAHRGLYGPDAPENSLEAFRRARDAGYGIELDVHLLKDGNLAVIHDANLFRVTGQNGFVEDLTTQELCQYRLQGTDETIPEFRSVLELYSGAAPLIVELKSVNNNYASLCEAACRMLDNYKGAYCLESFDPRCVRWLRKNRPDLIRGQLSENYFNSGNPALPWFLKFLLRNQMLNFLTLPDFVAYRYRDRKTISNYICRKFWKLQGVTWTVQNADEYRNAVEEDWIPIFENFCP